MSVITLPSLVIASAGAQPMGQDRFDLNEVSDVTGYGTANAGAPPRWRTGLEAARFLTLEEAAEWEAMVLRLRGRINHLAVHDLVRPLPLGTARGTGLTSVGTTAQGVASVAITGAYGRNRCRASRSIDNAAWTKTAGVTVTANYASAPAGLPGAAERVQYNGTGTAGSFRVYEDAAGDLFIPAAGQQVVCSVYLTAIAGTPTVRIANNLGNFTTCALTGSWQRFSVAGTGNGVAGLQLLLHSNTADNAAWDIAMYGAQIETGTTPTDYETGPTLNRGDWLQIGTGVGSHYCKAVDPVTLDDLGAGTVTFEPPTRKAFAAGSAITIERPVGHFKLVNAQTRWAPLAGAPAFSGFALDLQEQWS